MYLDNPNGVVVVNLVGACQPGGHRHERNPGTVAGVPNGVVGGQPIVTRIESIGE